ncbi:MAG TPA: tetratricopeptide repeat protein [Streptosporangiaceae bacterium]|jgi:tetratricopeptide (TPR) repeat protein/DNA-binding SARP family transcriptional activator
MSAANGVGRPPPGIPHGLAAALREFRLLSGLTQVELARRAGVSVGTVRDLEQGRRARPRAASVARLTQALGLDGTQSARLAGAAPQAREPAGAPVPGTGTGLQVRVLGPVAAWRDGWPLDVGSVRQRAVLALLALGQGSPVRRDALVDALWPEGPPFTAVNIVQGQISELRRTLGSGAVSRSGESYRLRLGPAELDVLAFGELTGQAGTPGDPVRSCGLYERALGLWRGEVAQDVVMLAGLPAVTAITARRAQAVTGLARLACELGQPDRALPELRALAGREPLNERAHAWLMTALAGAGQQAAALTVFEGCRARLDTELGVRPGPELTRAHERVLRQEDLPSVPAAQAAAVVPRQLPASVGGFVGRQEELATLTGLVQAGQPGQADGPGSADGPGRAMSTVVISAIGGTAGVGKTALAVRWAHQVADQFPGGQLYVNLRGYDPGQPVSAADALAGFLRALGVPGTDIAAGTDERAAQYRSLLAGRRLLIVLDNAGSVDQVRPLLPGAPSCAVVVTSRDTLIGLVAREGARRLDLDLLVPAEATGLLRELIGARAHADPVATARLAELCARLPLALRVAAEHVAARPSVPLAESVADLAGHPRRLDLLDAGGDARVAVRSVFSWSYRHLDTAAARAFRLAGLHPGVDFDLYALAGLTGTSLAQARRLARVLTGACLFQPAGIDRYTLHDLLREYARELAAAKDGQRGQQAALTRLFDHYLHTAAAATGVLYPAENPELPRPPLPGTVVRPSASLPEAQAWLDAELANLAATTVHGAGIGWPGYATGLGKALVRYLNNGHYDEGVTIHASAVQAARHTGDRPAEAEALARLGGVENRRGHHDEGLARLQQALTLCHEIGDQSGEAKALINLGAVRFQLGDYPQAASDLGQAVAVCRAIGDRRGEERALCNLSLVGLHQGQYRQATGQLEQALVICREIDDRLGAAVALDNLGLLALRQGRYQQAIGYHEQVLELNREMGNRLGECSALDNLGQAALRQGRYQQAAALCQQALALSRDIGERFGETAILVSVGQVALRQGHHQQADGHFRQALALCREIGDRQSETGALDGLGAVLSAQGRPDEARARYAAALQLASATGDKYLQARAHHGLGRAGHALGHDRQAHDHYRQALDLYTGLGVPEATEVRADLDRVLRRGQPAPG